MRQFMQQTEPEIIESVIAQRQADYGRAVHTLQRRAIEMRTREVLDAQEMDTMLGQKLLGKPGAFRGPAELRHLYEKSQIDCAGLIGSGECDRVRACKHFPTPNLEGIGVHF